MKTEDQKKENYYGHGILEKWIQNLNLGTKTSSGRRMGHVGETRNVGGIKLWGSLILGENLDFIRKTMGSHKNFLSREIH